MFSRTVTPEDLARLKQEREAADRLYNEVLSALDQARLREPVDLPHPPLGLDEQQITPINAGWRILPDAAPAAGGWRGKLASFVWGLIAPVLERQQHFNAQLVDHLNRNVPHHRSLREANESTLAVLGHQLRRLADFELLLLTLLQRTTPWVDTKDYEEAGLARRAVEDARDLLEVLQQRVDPRLKMLDERTIGMNGAISGLTDELLRRWESMVARERRYDAKVETLTDAQRRDGEEFRGAIAVLNQVSLTLKRELERPSARPPAARQPAATAGALPLDAGPMADAAPPAQTREPASTGSALDSWKYVGFEDRFRGSQEEIRSRLESYLPLFEGASDVLDVGCGRGELLDLFRERGISARGLDINAEMVEVCRARGLDAVHGDALGYLQALPDGTLGGLIAIQVAEHLEPDYLLAFLEQAWHKLRPGATIALETINPTCWFAFFSSYIRDLTHVRPLHPDTLSYLLTAHGFQRVGVRFSAPYPDRDKLQHAPGDGVIEEVMNANTNRLNALLFTHLDYAAIGVKG